MLVKGVALAEGQGKGGAIDYVKVSMFMGGFRSHVQCRTRWGRISKKKLLKNSAFGVGG